ncbi:MAG: hypothetical protein FWF77_05180 [Defluviitaleaceae bacterium]|nr:hypothetical protein [Defluviitaleaceae bacterium]
MLVATHSLEAGCSFPAHEKARQARGEHRGHVSKSTHSLEAISNFPAHEKNESASVTRRLVFADAEKYHYPRGSATRCNALPKKFMHNIIVTTSPSGGSHVHQKYLK